MNLDISPAQSCPSFWSKILAAGGLRLATWILAGTSLSRSRPALRWILQEIEGPQGIILKGYLSEQDDPEAVPGNEAPFAQLIFASSQSNVRVKHPYDLHSYARILAAYREKGLIP